MLGRGWRANYKAWRGKRLSQAFFMEFIGLTIFLTKTFDLSPARFPSLIPYPQIQPGGEIIKAEKEILPMHNLLITFIRASNSRNGK